MTDGVEEEHAEEDELVGEGKESFWWEKTVEFLFARKHLQNTIMPLAGALERFAGDAFLKSADHFGIIEFKACIKRAESERKKFRELEDESIESYTDYLPHIQTHYSRDISGREPHFMIYGVEIKGGLHLKTIDYWRRYRNGNGIDQRIEMECLPAEDFNDYLAALAKFKEPPKRSKFRGGSVIGVSNGEIVSLIPLDFLIHSLTYDLRPKPASGRRFVPGGGMGSSGG